MKMALIISFAKVLNTSFQYTTSQWENMTWFAVTFSGTQLLHKTTCNEFLFFPILFLADFTPLLY